MHPVTVPEWMADPKFVLTLIAAFAIVLVLYVLWTPRRKRVLGGEPDEEGKIET